MNTSKIRVLLVEDNPTDALLVQDELAHTASAQFSMVHVDHLKEALVRLKSESFDVVLLDLSLPDSHGFETFERLHDAAPALPLVVLSGQSDKILAIRAVQAGAQDYLVKGHMGDDVLPRSIGYAIERQRTAEDLRAAHAQLHQMLEHSPAVIYAFKMEGPNVVSYLVSNNITALLGFTVAEASHSEWWEKQIHPEDHARVMASISENLTSHPNRTEYRIRHKNGDYRWVEDSRRLIRDASNQPVEIVGIWADITERKHAEEVLRETARRKVGWQKAKLVKEVAVIFAVSCLVLVILNFTNLHQSPVRSFALKHLDQLNDVIAALLIILLGFIAVTYRRWKDYRAQASDQFLIQEALRTLHGELEQRIQQRTAELAKTNEDLRGEIAKHKQAEEALRESDEKFRQIATNINEAFWITDSSLQKIHYISPAYEKIWGRSCASLYASPRTWLEAVHPDDHARILTATETKFTRGDYDETYRILRPNGTVGWVHARGFPLHDSEGEVYRVVGTAEDITGQRQLEDQIRQSQKMEAFGQLASGVAHDFNNMIAVILGNSEIAMLITSPENAAYENLQQIKRASNRAKSLVQQILTFSRQQPQNRRVIDIKPIIEEAITFLRATIPAAVELNISVINNAPPVFADPTQLHQIIVNLCTNAWHALEDRPGCIEVKLQSVILDDATATQIAGLRPGCFACLSVSDPGKGMDAATLARIFEPFFTTKEIGKGTGLGLSVVHGIVQEHDGAITINSQPGQGTTFQVYLPAAATVDIAPAPAPVPQRGSGQHVLFLDDEQPLVALTTRMLEMLGYSPTGFVRAADAVKAFGDNPGQFDLVITDLNMPGTSGLAVAADLLKIRSDIPIMLCSGHVTAALRQQAQEMGIRDVLYKPSTMEEFSEAIHRLAARIQQS